MDILRLSLLIAAVCLPLSSGSRVDEPPDDPLECIAVSTYYIVQYRCNPEDRWHIYGYYLSYREARLVAKRLEDRGLSVKIVPPDRNS